MGLIQSFMALALARKRNKLSQSKLAKMVGTIAITIGRYEIGKIKPSIDVAAKIADAFGVTLDYLLGDAYKADLFKDPAMLQRLSDLEKLDEKNKSHILSVLDGFLQSVKIKNIAAL